MKKISFCNDWKVCHVIDNHRREPVLDVNLPYDGMIHTSRHADALNGSKKGYFENGVWEFYKVFEMNPSDQGKHIFIEFEGVYQNAMVYLNGSFIKKHVYGYTPFVIDISKSVRFDTKNVLKVIASSGDDSRWYSGCGIYRDVNLYIGERHCFAVSPLRIRITKADEKQARIEIHAEVLNKEDAEVIYEITDGENKIVSAENSITVESPKLWDEHHPFLYHVKAMLTADGKILDEWNETFGIRTLEITPEKGLLVNGKRVLLRGACIHHDNGVLGAVSLYEAEKRKIRLLKEAGFNAVRIAHHPAGRNILHVCDELGMYVMDEAFDSWQVPKSYGDYAVHFDECWEEDLTAMVENDYNHPSVILYSLGNEISDLAFPSGLKTLGMLQKKMKELDNTRFTTCAVNNVMLIIALGENQGLMNEEKKNENAPADVNETMNDMREKMKEFTQGPICDMLLKGPAGITDIAGYNYMGERYGIDEELHPERIILGTETYPRDILRNWEYMISHKNCIGDFTWTGWDYLGETGIGKITYKMEHSVQQGIYGDYPYVTAFCGDLDITGRRLPASYYREIIFGLRKKPYIVTHSPEHYDEKPILSLWSFDDVKASYDYPGWEGKKMTVDVYSSSEEVELFQNGTYLGKRKVTDKRATFDITYVPGLLLARTVIGGKTYEDHLATCRKGTSPVIDVQEENGILFVNYSYQDDQGVTDIHKEETMTLKCSENLLLLGMGNGSPIMEEERYDDNIHSLYEGRGFAVLKRLNNEKGFIQINKTRKEL